MKHLFLIMMFFALINPCVDNKNSINNLNSENSNVAETVLKVPSAVDVKKNTNLPKLPDTIKNKDEIIPDGWSMLDILENDFNSDGLLDMVGVIEHPLVDDELYPRILFVYMNNGNGYNKNVVNQYLIRNSDEGGIFGDPYQKLTAQDNTFTTHTFGGSAWKWHENYTFSYKDGEWFLLYKENIGSYGPFETTYSYDDYKIGVGERRYTEESPEKENPVKLEFTIRLDEKPLLTDFAYDSTNRERIKAPKIKSIDYNEGLPHFKEYILSLNVSNVQFQNKDYVIYGVNESEGIVYLMVYNYANEHLQVIYRYDSVNGEIFSHGGCNIYKNRLYFQEDIRKMVDVRRDGEIKKQSEVVAVQFVSMNIDGSDKKVIFTAENSKYKENEIIDNYLGFLTLSYEIAGDEIIIEVYEDGVQTFYRMNLDGRDRKLIGSVPKGLW